MCVRAHVCVILLKYKFKKYGFQTVRHVLSMLTIAENGPDARRGKRILEVAALWCRKRTVLGLRKLVQVHVLLPLMNCMT